VNGVACPLVLSSTATSAQATMTMSARDMPHLHRRGAQES
jgi:hypothetical protein